MPGTTAGWHLQQADRAAAFRALHEGEPFLIPNPWDGGSARVLEDLGFRALATTSSGFAFTLGRSDGAVTLDELAEHVRTICAATALPVSADLENGYGASPEAAATAITRAAEAGAVGGSIEDWDPEGHLYDLDHAVARVAAAVEAARALPFPFTFTARAENHIRGNPDLDDTIARLRAYEEAGADVLYAPGLRDADAVRAVCAAVVTAGERARPRRPVDARDRRGRRAAGQRRRRADLGGGAGARGRRDDAARRGRLLRPARPAALVTPRACPSWRRRAGGVAPPDVNGSRLRRRVGRGGGQRRNGSVGGGRYDVKHRMGGQRRNRPIRRPALRR